MDAEELKKLCGEKAAEYVKDGMVVGLGTGSTVHYTIMKLGEMVKNGLNITAMATSIDTENKAKNLNIKLTDINKDTPDLTIDGADEVDPQKNLIKGGGGALTREKIIDYRSKEFIVVADERKVVQQLGERFYLPVEVLPFSWERVKKELAEKFGFERVELRKKDNETYLTDNKNYILDCYGRIENPAQLEKDINNIPGVLENGLFTNCVTRVVVGKSDGVEVIE
jgi:ribose 5-phosphate isomerase A